MVESPELVISMTKDQAAKIMKMTQCPKCELEAKSLLHKFCTHQDCPIKTAIEVSKEL